VKPNINLVEVHPQLSNNGHPVDGVLVGASSLWPSRAAYKVFGATMFFLFLFSHNFFQLVIFIFSNWQSFFFSWFLVTKFRNKYKNC